MSRAEQRRARPRANESKEMAEQVPLEMPALEPIITPMLEEALQNRQDQLREFVVQSGTPEVTLQVHCGPDRVIKNQITIYCALGTVADIVHLTADYFLPGEGQSLVYAEIEIRRQIRSEMPELPPHSGIALYRAMLDFFQDYANTHNRLVEHVVRCSMEMPLDKWKAIFLPTLEEYGYHGPFLEDLMLSYNKVYEPKILEA